MNNRRIKFVCLRSNPRDHLQNKLEHREIRLCINQNLNRFDCRQDNKMKKECVIVKGNEGKNVHII